MAEENIQIIVHDDGRIEFRTHDIKGEACMEELEEILYPVQLLVELFLCYLVKVVEHLLVVL